MKKSVYSFECLQFLSEWILTQVLLSELNDDMFGKNRLQTILIRFLVLSGAAFWGYIAFTGKDISDALTDILKLLMG